MKLDLSKFKKVKDSQSEAVLQHPDGHHIRIAKKVLSPEMQKDLGKLKMHFDVGGAVPGEGMDAPVSVAPVVAEAAQPVPEAAPEQGFDLHKFWMKKANDTIADPEASLDDKINARKSIDEISSMGERAAVAAKQSELEKQKNEYNKVQEYNQLAQKQGGQTIPAPMAPAGMPKPEVPADPNAAKLEALRVAMMGNTQPSAQAPSMQTPDFSSGYDMFKQGLQGQVGPNGAIQQESNAQQQLNNEQAKNYDMAIDQTNDINSKIQDNLVQMQKHTEEFDRDMKEQHIDPLRWWHEKSAPAKIMTGIGMLIGGMGNALLKQDPMAFVNKLIDNDIQAQKENVGHTKSIYDANLNQYKNANTAAEMTRINMNQMVQNMIAKTAAKSGNPIVQAKANQMINTLKMDASSKMNEIAMRQAMLGGMNGMGSGSDEQIARQTQMLRMMGNKDMADDLEARHVPGIGMAQVKVTPEVRMKLVNGKVLDEAIADLQSFIKQNGTAVNKLGATPEALRLKRSAETKARRVQDLYRQANNQGVFKESEKDFVEKSINSNPLKFFSDIAVLPGLENTRQQNLQQLNELRGSVGLPVSYKPSSAKAFTGE